MKKPCNYCQPNRPRPPKKICCKGVEIDYIEIPVSAGTDAPGQPLAPENGAHKNAVVRYAANDHTYIYTSEGIPVQISWGRAGDAAVFSVNGKTGDVVLTTADLENTSDYVTGTQVIVDINDALSTLATVASTGSYNDLQDLPTIPTKVSQLQNDSGYQTASQVSTAVGGEANLRVAADNNLQGQIDAIAASSDVTDIVGTYAALEAYDTSKLKDNDIIKVLQDEQHNDETTYYRWSTHTETFTLIGEEGPYYTKSAADQKFQEKLIAGTNIQIANDGKTISATDTTYTAGTNVSISAANQISAKAKTIFYVNVLETGTTKHIYKDDSFTMAATAQEVITAIENTAVMVSMSELNSPTEVNVLALENYWNYPGDIQFIFTDGNTLYDFGCSATTDTVFDYSTGTLQKKLTAGSNVSIVGTTISATDTTYSDFTGATSLADGAAGLVPKPLIADEDKYLKGDGTWDTVSAGPTVVQTAGTSTTDVMSQDATTKMIFPKYGVTSPSNGAVVIGKNADAQSSDTASTAYPSVVIGQGAKGGNTFSSQGDTGAVVIGAEAEARGFTDNYGIAIGYAADSSGGHIAIGHRAATHTANSSKFNIAIGEETRQNTGDNQQHNGMVALGAYAKNSRSNEVSVGNPSNTTYTTRYLANVTDPQLAQDAATKNYVDGRILAGGTTAPTTTTVGEVGTLYAYVSGTTGHLAICTEIDTTDPDNPSYTWQTLV